MHWGVDACTPVRLLRTDSHRHDVMYVAEQMFIHRWHWRVWLCHTHYPLLWNEYAEEEITETLRVQHLNPPKLHLQALLHQTLIFTVKCTWTASERHHTLVILDVSKTLIVFCIHCERLDWMNIGVQCSISRTRYHSYSFREKLFI